VHYTLAEGGREDDGKDPETCESVEWKAKEMCGRLNNTTGGKGKGEDSRKKGGSKREAFGQKALSTVHQRGGKTRAETILGTGGKQWGEMLEGMKNPEGID